MRVDQVSRDSPKCQSLILRSERIPAQERARRLRGSEQNDETDKIEVCPTPTSFQNNSTLNKKPGM